MSSSNHLPQSYSSRYPKRLRGRLAKSAAEAAINSVRSETVELFEQAPLCGAALGAGAASGTTGAVNTMITGKNAFEYAILGAGQTLVAPDYRGSSGLDVSLDQTADEGIEITQGISSRSRSAFTVGTSPKFFASIKFSIADVSGTDDCAFGFRKAEAYQANVDDYDEGAWLNVISGNIKIETILNGAATVTTDTTNDWADAATHTLRVEVDMDGVCTFKIDDAAPTVTAAHTFDDGEVVVPFFYLLHDVDLAGAVDILEWRVGLV